MRYTPRHAIAKPSSFAGRRTAGVALVSAATVGAGLASAGAAHAATPYNVWDRVAACESGGNWAISTGNGFYGGLQFTTSTWNGFGGGKYASSAQYASRDQQISIAQNVLRVQGPGAWPVCSKRAGLTTSNGLAVVVNPGTGTNPSPNPPPSRGGARTLAIDGSFGPLTTQALQKWVGTRQDGSFGPITKRALQRKIGVVQDGVIGPQTIAALQTRIGASHDGAWQLNAATVRVLQAYLNRYVV
ncbi:transglycosylase family protein [Leekyejoonella antrihumi]|uniref:Transglycosylase n=1 Tax=Leekyejoonella antrihumi TaxID=1660198 RepID=A0A563E8K8_9MICO|nr:transglycosylase family protein [Leekyejoonella antrihumi]TWP38860.1 transglycosylase [Leekyejoonella antrihumi]